MRRLRALLVRVAGLVGVGRGDREIAEELRIHREMLADEYRQAGLGEAEAQRRAAADCGSLTSAASAYRDRRSVPLLENWLRDGRIAFRSLRRSPAMCASMVGVLGLGIGFSASIATVLYAIAWRDLPVADPGQVVRIATDYHGPFSHQVIGGGSQVSYPDFNDYRSRAHALVSVAAMTHDRITWRQETEANALSAAFVTGDYFRTLEVAPELGRLLSTSDRHEADVVISRRLWMKAFAGKTDVLGQAMSLDRSPYTIVGVAPDSFTGTEVVPVDVWLPLEVATTAQGHGDRLGDRRAVWLQSIGRLASRTSVTAAAAEATVVFEGLDVQVPGRQTIVRMVRASRLDAVGLLGSHEAPVLVGAASVALTMMVALLVVCGSNAASLLLARGASRQKEIAVRLALGASRGRLAQQMLAEIALIAAASVLVGVLVCMGSLRVLTSLVETGGMMPPALVPDGSVLLSSVSFALVVACFFGLAPLRQALQVDCLANLKGEVSSWGRQVGAVRFRRGLVATQVGISVVLLVASALLGRGVSQSFRIDPGYVTRGLFVIHPDVNPRPTGGLSGMPSAVSFRVRDTLAQVPGIESVAAVAIPPYGGSGSNSARAEGMSAPVQVHFNEIDEHYFPVLGVHAAAGRLLRIDDGDAAVVNTRLAHLFWGSDEKAIGQRFEAAVAGYGTSERSIEVVGVIPSIQTTTAGMPDEPTYYVRLSADRASSSFLIVRARPATPVARLAVDAARAVDADAVTTTEALDERLAARTVPARVGAIAAGLLGVLALLVSAVGIHGIVGHAVTARTRDIGVYQALGAPAGRIMRLVLGWTLRGVAIGLIAGSAVVAIVVLTFPTLVRAALLGLSPSDPLAIIGAAAFLATVIFGAAYLPARRALGIGPRAALRHE